MKGLLLCHVVPQRYRERRRLGGEFLFTETIVRHYVNFWGFIIKFEGGKKGATAVCGEKNVLTYRTLEKKGCMFIEILTVK